MPVVIEKAVAGDALAIAEVHVASMRAAYQGVVPDHLEILGIATPDISKRGRSWRRWLGRSRASTFVARVDGTVRGFCALHPLPGVAEPGVTAEIAAIYVLPAHWRHGLGRRLCETALVDASARGFSEVAVWVLELNERARRFYESLGFRPDGEARIFLERPEAPLLEIRSRRPV